MQLVTKHTETLYKVGGIIMTHEEQVKRMTDMIAKFVGFTGKKLPDDVIAKLTELREKETEAMPKVIYDTMFRNQELASAVLGQVRHEIPADR